MDVCIHEPSREGDERNHHAHILTTTRRIEGDELTTKTRELDDRKTGAIEEVREKWAELTNKKLEQAQTHERVDHRSHERLGLEEVPTIHEGPVVTNQKRRGRESGRAAENRESREANSLLQSAREALKHVYESIRDRLPGHHEPAAEPKPRKKGLLGALSSGRRTVEAEREKRLGKPLAGALRTIEGMQKGKIPLDRAVYAQATKGVRDELKRNPAFEKAMKPDETQAVRQALQHTRAPAPGLGLGRGRER